MTTRYSWMCRLRKSRSDSPLCRVVSTFWSPLDAVHVVVSLLPLGVAEATASECWETQVEALSPELCLVVIGSVVVPVVVIACAIVSYLSSW